MAMRPEVVQRLDPGQLCVMIDAKISESRNGLSRYLALARKGEVVRILDGKVPIAQTVPIAAPVGAGRVGDEALADLGRKGLVRRGSGEIPREILERDPPGRPAGVLDALLEQVVDSTLLGPCRAIPAGLAPTNGPPRSRPQQATAGGPKEGRGQQLSIHPPRGAVGP